MVCSLLSYAPMSLFVVGDSSSSGLILSHLLYKAAFVIALIRWALYWALRLRQSLSNDSSVHHDDYYEHAPSPVPSSSCSCSSSSSSSSSQLIRDCLVRRTFEEIVTKRSSMGKSGSDGDTCAVCLSQLEMGDEVRELRNCCHVFHTECIDRWLDYHDHHHQPHDDDDDDNHRTCPLCRTPLLTSSQIQSLSWEHSRAQQPSWAVERLLYLFGEDLLL